MAESSVRPQSWRKWLYVAAFALALLIGGGGAEGPKHNGIIAALGIFLFMAAAAESFGGGRGFPAHARMPTAIAGILILIPIFQLVPLPPAIWQALPGRETAALALDAIGHANDWRPLSLDPDATRRFLLALPFPIAIYLHVIRTSRDNHLLLLSVLVACAALSGLVGVLQLSLGHPDWLSFYDGPSAGAASGFLANPNHQALFMVAGMVATTILLRSGPIRSDELASPRSRQLVGWAFLFFFALMTLASGSRAGLLMLAIALPGTLLLAIGGRSLPRLAAGLVGAIALLALVGLVYPSTNTLPMSESFRVVEDVRYGYLPDIIYTLWQYWPAGSGLGTFAQIFGANENLDLARHGYLNHAHNDLLEWVIETGALGAVWLGLALLAIIYAGYRRLRHGQSDAYLIPLALLFIIISAIHSLADYPLRTATLASTLALFVGLVGSTPNPGDERAKPAGRRWALAIAMLIALPLAAETLRLSLVQHALRSDNHRLAAMLGPTNARVLVQQAGVAMRRNEIAVAEQAAAQAILSQPINVAALRSLASVREAQGKAARSVWQLASSLGWRDEGTQLWAFRQALADGQASTAALRTDALLRTGQPPASFVKLVRAAAANPDFAGALANRLRLNPDWRRNYFTLAKDPSAVEVAGLMATIDHQARSDDPPQRADGSSLITHLIRKKAYAEAARVDRMLAGPRSGTANLIDDGGFDRPLDDYSRNSTPFDWRVAGSGSIETAPSTKLIAESNGEKPETVATRYVDIPPGSYRLTYRASAEAPNAFRVRLACANSHDTLAQGATPESREMTEQSIDVTIPAGCGLLQLKVEGLPSGTATTSEYDDFRLLPN